MEDKFTRYAKKIIRIIAVLLFIISCISFVYVIYDGIIQYSFSIKTPEYFVNFIGLFSKYEGLYSATFVAIATYYVLNQYIENFKSNNTAIKQLQSQLQEINDRIEKEKVELTMVQCKYFYEEVQSSVKEMYRSIEETLKIDHISWEINDFTEEDLFKQDPYWHNKFDLIPNNLRDKIILSMSKLEIFSIYFMHGNADLDIGFNTVGKDFCRQIINIYPLISIWRSRARPYNENFYNKTTELFKKWNGKLEEIRKIYPQHAVICNALCHGFCESTNDWKILK